MKAQRKANAMRNLTQADMDKEANLLSQQREITLEGGSPEEAPGIVYNVDFSESENRGVVSIHSEEIEDFHPRMRLFDFEDDNEGNEAA